MNLRNFYAALCHTLFLFGVFVSQTLIHYYTNLLFLCKLFQHIEPFFVPLASTYI